MTQPHKKIGNRADFSYISKGFVPTFFEPQITVFNRQNKLVGQLH